MEGCSMKKSKVETKQIMIFQHEDTKEEKTIEIPLPAVGMAMFNAIRKEFPDKPESEKWIMKMEKEIDPYFDPQTTEEIINRLQEYAKCGLAANARKVHHAWEWANKLRAQIEQNAEELKILREIADQWMPPFGVPHKADTIALFARLDAVQQQFSNNNKEAK